MRTETHDAAEGSGAGMAGPAFDATTALVVADVQNDFADPAGSLYVTRGEEIVPTVNELVEAAEAAGALVVYTQDWHPPVTPHFAKDGGRWPVHCVAGTWGAALHPSLRVVGPIVHKGVGPEDGYSGFTVRDPRTGATTRTSLPALLEGRGITRLVVVGLALDYCVKETVLDARQLGYPATVVQSACRAINAAPDDDARAVAEMEGAGAEVR